ncbi:DUF2109 family protein [Vibrio alginolyticus]|uniref:DUF2109 family protein n=1 Tax=Vibrio alginolyticus TaxID=663 RepID=UPI003981729D
MIDVFLNASLSSLNFKLSALSATIIAVPLALIVAITVFLKSTCSLSKTTSLSIFIFILKYS